VRARDGLEGDPSAQHASAAGVGGSRLLPRPKRSEGPFPGSLTVQGRLRLRSEFGGGFACDPRPGRPPEGTATRGSKAANYTRLAWRSNPGFDPRDNPQSVGPAEGGLPRFERATRELAREDGLQFGSVHLLLHAGLLLGYYVSGWRNRGALWSGARPSTPGARGPYIALLLALIALNYGGSLWIERDARRGKRLAVLSALVGLDLLVLGFFQVFGVPGADPQPAASGRAVAGR